MTVTGLDQAVDVVSVAGNAIKAVGGERDAPLRPSPWHEIAHSLSEAPSPIGTPGRPRRASQPSPLATNGQATPAQTPPIAALSTSQALRDWEALLAQPESDAKRHHLVHVPANSCAATPTGVVPKLAAERDKDGHIEYKLKLIDPTPERFERLVTQMLWRLKQGRGEAIYEIGLADDGTVIGLTRPEMEASLRTLEQMAADIGGTVMILREVVLYGSVSNLPSPAPALSSSVSSAASLSDNGPPELWTIRRPDLDDRGQPRRGSHAVKGEPVISRRARVRAKWEAGPSDFIRGDRKLIFGVEDLALAEADAALSDEASPEQPHRETSALADEDIPPFHLDLEDAPVPVTPPAPGASRAPPKVKTKPPRPPPSQGKKAREKAEKSAARREQRRLDLFKGDGTNPDWALMAEAAISDARAHLPTLPATAVSHDTQPQSSLRLASTAASPEEDLFLAELLRHPLDNLSLSFAEVRTVAESGSCRSTSSIASSPSARTELARSPAPEDSVVQPGGSGRLGPGTRYVPPLPGEELICVEALVIRKSATEDQWGGREEDGWSAAQEEEDPWDFFG